MKENTRRRPILGNTNDLLTGVERPPGGGGKDFPRTYEEAQLLLAPQLSKLESEVSNLNSELLYQEEIVVCLRIHPDFLAKSYELANLYGILDDTGVGSPVGVRLWRAAPSEVLRTNGVEEAVSKGQTELEGRIVFLRLKARAGISAMRDLLKTPEQELPRTKLADEFRRIERIDLLNKNERIIGFSGAWTGGRAELVFHPSSLSIEERKQHLEQFLRTQGSSCESARYAYYPDSGILFASVRFNGRLPSSLGDYQPLRVAKPLNPPNIEFVRTMGTAIAPFPPANTRIPVTKVVVFDGGLHPNHPLLKGYAIERGDLAIDTPASSTGVAHGTMVAGAVIHGALNQALAKQHLPIPDVGVISVRVLPTSDPTDVDLYESIDVVERAVPKLVNEAKIFNFSFGPRGPISDDEISRFTYVLDKLSYDYGIIPVVAAGNDAVGIEDPYSRIQAPGDAVNAICVGAYTLNNGASERASYSCVGPGREGGKIKPDILAFGGDDLTPFHAVGMADGERVYAMGTSLSTPLVSRALGQVLDRCPGFDSLMGRILLTHQAQLDMKNGLKNKTAGFGLLREDVDTSLLCLGNTITAVYQQTILPGKYLRLEFPLPDTIALTGRVRLNWTIGMIAPVDASRPLEYTGQSFEYSYYPHKLKHKFSLYNGADLVRQKILHVVEDWEEIDQLERDGWKRSKLPAAASPRRESDLRKQQMKWDTVISETANHNGSSIYAPHIVLHAFERHSSVPLRFAALVTITAETADVDLYQEVRSRLSFLQPIQIRTQQQIRS